MDAKGVIQNRVVDLVNYIVSEKKTTKEKAYKWLMSTNTFAMLNDTELKIWAEPSGYWIDKLKQEMNGDMETWRNIW